MIKLKAFVLAALVLSGGTALAHNLCTTNAVVQFVQSHTGGTCSSNGAFAWKCTVPGQPASRRWLVWGQGSFSPSSNSGQYLLQLDWDGSISNIETIFCRCPGDPDVCRVTHVY